MRDYYARNAERVKAQVKARQKQLRADPVQRERLRELDKERTRRWRERNPERSRALATARVKKWRDSDPIGWRNAQWKHYYGIPLLTTQRCWRNREVCARSAPRLRATFYCTSTTTMKPARFAGWLCRGCNSGIGFFKESEESMLKAIEYLRPHNAKQE